jgi:hypothetical protein
MLFLEQVANHVRLLLSTMQVTPDIPDHFRLAGRSALAERVGLHVLIQQLVRIQLGTIPRQPDQAQAQACSVIGNEPLDGARSLPCVTAIAM